MNARLTLDNIPMSEGELKISLWRNNLTDDDHPSYGINFGSLGLLTEQYGEPRTYGLDVSYHY